jgi:predicted ATPase
MAAMLDKLTIHGFKSIRELNQFELHSLNILIGANGAGKSNFVEIFRMLRAMVDQNLNSYVQRNGGADGFFFNGPQVTESINCKFEFGSNSYRFDLVSTAAEKLLITTEATRFLDHNWNTIGSSEYESQLDHARQQRGRLGHHSVAWHVYDSLSNWVVYHFHDTSNTAPMRRSEIVQDSKRLRDDAANIAPFLHRLRDEESTAYYHILNAVRLVTPFFEDFLLDPVRRGEAEQVNLSWRQRGSDYPMQPYHLSDGSIRFICLATALLQPDPPSTIIIDEPELGLHPYALAILAELIQSAAATTQVIISTQSPALVDHFSAEDLIVVNRKAGASTFKRLDSSELDLWLDEYTLGELWQKNVVLGGPVYE